MENGKLILPDGYEEPPLDKEGNPKKKFEVRLNHLPDDTIQKAIFIDGDHFDWEVDEESFEIAQKMGPQYFAAVQKDIMSHFIRSLCEFLDKEVSVQEFMEATQTGWI